MTTRRAAPARIGLDEIQRQIPFAEGDLVCEQFGVLAGMDHVADLAAFASVLPVDMDVMHIFFAIPEPRCIGCRGKLEQVAVMAAEAKLEFGIIVGNIELRRVWFDQELVIRRPVRIVAGSALPVFYGAVKYGLVLFDQILMAVEAEVLPGIRQEFWRIARMGIMTRRTAPLCFNGRVDAFGRLESVFDRGMTLVAEAGSFRREKPFH